MMALTSSLFFFTLILTSSLVAKNAEARPKFWESGNYAPILNDEYKSAQYNARLQRELANNVALLLAGDEDLPWPPYGGRFVQSKRQIRYNQCYFNPISCFRKRK
ncbi:uncharacterized protein LOC111087421 [Limulus polyphemus]|uniref:Uncharacterized protein LOC111087421 n=1 Tax=Limulus polyphemus TaxID=6850 RepID=A0ABM1T1F7_LIMPO|nr:uncharacterized protein LOC111087421 [Limulus polyphemus]